MAGPGQTGSRYAPQGGTPCPLLRRGTPAPGRRWLATPPPLPGNRGAPARGVDVKPPRNRGPGEAPGGSKPPKMPKMGIFPEKVGFWPFLAKMAIFTVFRDFSGSRKRGFTSTPRAGAPVTPFWGFRSPGPGEPREGPFWALFGEIPQNGGFWGSGAPGVSRPPGYRGAPARGVDVKPPSPGPPGPGPGASPRIWVPRTPPGVRRPSGRPSRAPPGEGDPRPGAPAPGVLHQPLAPAPRGSPGGVRGPGAPGRGVSSRWGYPPPGGVGGGCPLRSPRGVRGPGLRGGERY